MSTPFPLGRKVNHDPRSLAYPALVPAAAPLKPVSHKHYGPVLDQGNIGSCTGNAAAQTMNTRPFHKPFSAYLTETDALEIYTMATKIDPFQGEFPAQDTGSDGLSVAKVLRQQGRITSYGHGFGIDHVRAALQLGPALVGTNWYESMFHPDAKGRVEPSGNVAGGHEYVLLGDNQKGWLRFLNSWSGEWGFHGFFYMTYESFSKLLHEDGDVTVPVK